MWNEVERQYYFTDDGIFTTQYCSPLTRCQIGTIPNTLVRSVLDRIAELAPSGAHSSPNWSGFWRNGLERPHPALPIVVIGKIGDAKSISGARCGLYNKNGELYFWLTSDDVPTDSTNWTEWGEGGRYRNDDLRLYNTPLGTHNAVERAFNKGGDLHARLTELNAKWEERNNTLTAERLTAIKNDLKNWRPIGEKQTFAFTPRIVSEWPDSTTVVQPISEPKVHSDQSPSEALQMKKNIILFGPPGTGKTYSTIAVSMAAVDENSVARESFNRSLKSENLSTDKVEEFRADFSNKVRDGEIVFTTFHQNFSYEDFIEGIRVTSTVEGNALYETRNGIFKKLARKALFYKLANAISKDTPQKSLEIGSERFRIAAEFFASTSDEKISEQLQLKRPINFSESESTHHKLETAKTEALEEFRVVFEAIKAESYRSEKSTEGTKKFVLIIDEINRGNISKIFGELITLIEDTKRYGGGESLSVILPYSQESFFVPDNLYIVGTMNTADRSLATLDIALRRRFQFIEMMPRPSFLKEVEIDGINLETWLTRLNENIEILRGREFTLGHAFFKDLKDEKNRNIETLAEIMRGSILPLLDEYFFEDWEGIRDVLGVKTDVGDLAFITRVHPKADMPNVRGKKQYIYSWNSLALKNPAAYQQLCGNSPSIRDNSAE
jgi:hypothetical protein